MTGSERHDEKGARQVGERGEQVNGRSAPTGAGAGEQGRAVPMPAYVVQSADHVLQLLRVLVEKRSLRVTDAAEILGVVPSTAHRLLATLCYQGFALQERRGGRYVPGPAVAAITLSRGDTIDLRAMARPVLERLREETQETVSLIVLEGTAAHFVDSIEGPQSVRVSARLGLSSPAHCTSAGKALLALLPRGELLARYPNGKLAKGMKGAINTRRLLEAELAEVRGRGYACMFHEGEVEIGGVSVAIPDEDGGPLAALAVAAPISRLGTVAAASEVAGPLQRAVQDLRNVLASHRFPIAPGDRDPAAGRAPTRSGSPA